MDFISVLRQFRIGPFTIFDTAAAYIGIFFLAPLLTKIFSKIHVNISRGWLAVVNFANFSIISSDFSPKHAFYENALKSPSVSILLGNNHSFIYDLYGFKKN